MSAAERFGEAAVKHVAKGGCAFAQCGLCRAAFAISMHPEWKGVLPMNWKDFVSDQEWDSYRHDEDPFRRSIRVAVLLEQRKDQDLTDG